MAAVMGIGRFVYTPILPYMSEAVPLSASQAGLIAAANFLGYLVGSLASGTGFLEGNRRTWALWALGRIGVNEVSVDQEFEKMLAAENPQANTAIFNQRLQAIRILAFRNQEAETERDLPNGLIEALGDLDMARFTRRFPPVLDTLMKNILDILYIYEQERVDEGEPEMPPNDPQDAQSGNEGEGQGESQGDGGGERSEEEGDGESSQTKGQGGAGGEDGDDNVDEFDMTVDGDPDSAAREAAAPPPAAGPAAAPPPRRHPRRTRIRCLHHSGGRHRSANPLEAVPMPDKSTCRS